MTLDVQSRPPRDESAPHAGRLVRDLHASVKYERTNGL